MVFYFICSIAKINHKPEYLFFDALIITLLSAIASYWIFPTELISLGILMFITIGALPLFIKLFSYSSYISNYQKPFFKRHSALFKVLAYFFLGVFVSFILLFFIVSLNYSLVEHNDSDFVYLKDSYNQDYKLVFNLDNYSNLNKVKIDVLKNNNLVTSSLFSNGQYIEFNNYKFDKTLLITSINDDKITISCGDGLREDLFYTQLSEVKGISNIKSNLTGNIKEANIKNEEKGIFGEVFSLVFKNNLRVLLIAAFLSFLYGAGAIFLISWNASILAAVISLDIFVSMAPVIYEGVFGFFIGLFNSFYLFLGYLPHGIPEILAYFIISFAGAMFSRDLFKGIFATYFKWTILKDLLYMLLFAFLFLIIGALIEASYFL